MPRATFRAYLKVMRNKPGFWFGVVSVVAFTTRNAVEEGLLSAVVCIAIGCLIGVAMFPWWRKRAGEDPFTYTYGQPELLADDAATPQAHPSEPLCNVHIEEPLSPGETP